MRVVQEGRPTDTDSDLVIHFEFGSGGPQEGSTLQFTFNLQSGTPLVEGDPPNWGPSNKPYGFTIDYLKSAVQHMDGVLSLKASPPFSQFDQIYKLGNNYVDNDVNIRRSDFCIKQILGEAFLSVTVFNPLNAPTTIGGSCFLVLGSVQIPPVPITT